MWIKIIHLSARQLKLLIVEQTKKPPRNEVALKIWMGGVSIISGSLMGAQGAFPARQILYYYCGEIVVLSSLFNRPDLQYASIFDMLTSKSVET